ncbi:MAG: GNAT family N-acetyltransferase [Thermoleophilaceae bacterium]
MPAVGGTVEWIEDPERLGTLAEAWDALAERDGTPFSSHAWFDCWWNAFGNAGGLAVCVLWRGDELAAVLPLRREGGALRSLANLHTPLFCPLAADRAALEQVLAATLDTHAVEVELFGVPDGDPALAALCRASAERRRLVHREPQHVSPIVDTSGTLAAYLAERGGRFREIVRRRRKMEREHGARFAPIGPPDDLSRELQRGLELEARGWKGKAATAIISDTRTEAFYRRLAERFHASGELRFSTLELEGRLVAFDLALVHADRYWLLKTAYDESWARFGPGMALRVSVIQRCFELGLEAHEFLGDDMEHKRRFSTSERRHQGIRSYSRRPRSALGYVYRRRARPVLRRAYRRLAPTRSGRRSGRWTRVG